MFAGFVCVYIFLQTFAIPGSIFLSIISGFLFPFPLALFAVCFCSATGNLMVNRVENIPIYIFQELRSVICSLTWLEENWCDIISPRGRRSGQPRWTATDQTSCPTFSFSGSPPSSQTGLLTSCRQLSVCRCSPSGWGHSLVSPLPHLSSFRYLIS